MILANNCTHEVSHPDGGQNWLCSNCGAFTHLRCQAFDVDGEQCILIEGHETSDCEIDRPHKKFVIGNMT